MYSDSECREMMEAIRKMTRNKTLLQIWTWEKSDFDHADAILRFVDPQREAETVLDLGCGTGQFLYAVACRRKYKRCIGLNLFQSQLDLAVNTTGLELYQQDITQPFYYDDVDLAFLNHVSGHLHDEAILDLLQRLAKMGVKKLAMWDIFPTDITVNEVFGYTLRSPLYWRRLIHNAGWCIEKWNIPPDAELSENFKLSVSAEDVITAQRLTRPMLVVVKPRENKEESN